MGNKYLRTVKIKNCAATHVLKEVGWPKASHQKIVDKKYNAKFKKAASTADTVLKAAADLNFPIMKPKQLADLKKQLQELLSVNLKNAKLIQEAEKLLSKNDANVKKLEWAFKSHQKLHSDARKLAQRCADDAKVCGVQNPSLLYSEREADKWHAEMNRLKKNEIYSEDEIKILREKMKPLQKQQQTSIKHIGKALVLVVGVGSVMP